MNIKMNRRTFLQSGTIAITLMLIVGFTQSGSSLKNVEKPSVKVTWFGAATMSLEFNGFTILTDPSFGQGAKAFTMGDPNEMFDLAKGPNVKDWKRVTSFVGKDLKSSDLVILSHAHEDHFDQKAQTTLKKNIPMVLPPSDIEKVTEMGFSNLSGLGWGQSRSYNAGSGKVRIIALQADHSENEKITDILGKGNGYWIEFTQGDWKRSFYWAGDTFGTENVINAVTSLGEPDLMIPHMGAVGTSGPLGKISMGASDLIPFIKAIKPKNVLLIHHSTYELYLEPISKISVFNDDAHLPLNIVSEGVTLIYR